MGKKSLAKKLPKSPKWQKVAKLAKSRQNGKKLPIGTLRARGPRRHVATARRSVRSFSIIWDSRIFRKKTRQSHIIYKEIKITSFPIFHVCKSEKWNKQDWKGFQVSKAAPICMDWPWFASIYFDLYKFLHQFTLICIINLQTDQKTKMETRSNQPTC